MKMLAPYRISFLFLLLFTACRQAYEPPAIKAPNHFLVVEGVINAAPNSKTTIVLTRARNLSDTILTSPESAAIVKIESKAGSFYNLVEQGNGSYVTDRLTLNKNDSYRLKISTVDGKEYASEFVPVKATPPIDSLSWTQDKDVTVYANTHDPLNAARYYRWDFVETWQYQSQLQASLGASNGLIFYRDSTNQIFNCWSQDSATEIILASSINLGQDVIDHAPITIIKQSSEKISVRYSILVKQYALTEEAYKYWEILQKNTQQLGTLFDPQPSQLKSNIHNIANASEPVLGFVSACVVEEKRLFINNRELQNWAPVPEENCMLKAIPQDPVNYLIYNDQDTAYVPYYFVSGGGIMLAKKICLDCTTKGGTNQKPFFW
jgi:hypothetical protein